MNEKPKSCKFDADKYIGKQVKFHRQRLNISVDLLAEFLGMTPVTLTEAENGLKRFCASDLLTLKKLFNVPLSNFFTDCGQYISDAVLENTEMADVFHYYTNIEDKKTRAHILSQIKLASSVF